MGRKKNKTTKIDFMGETFETPSFELDEDVPELFGTFLEAGKTPSREFKRTLKFKRRFDEVEDFIDQQDSYEAQGRIRRLP